MSKSTAPTAKQPEKTKTELALEYIAAKGSARTSDIAEHLGIKTNNIQAMLDIPLKSGYLIACKVTAPGKPPLNEYRLSATASADKQSWAEFKVARAKKPAPIPPKAPSPIPKPVLTCKPPEPQKPAPAASYSSPAPVPKKPAEPAQAPAPIKHETASAAVEKPEAPAGIYFLIGHDGRLRIEQDGKLLCLSNSETRQLGELLHDTEPVWA